MDPRQELEALRRMAELEAKAAGKPKGGIGGGNVYKGPSLLQEMRDAAPAAGIAMGYDFDKMARGARELNTSLEVIKGEALGRDTSPQTSYLGTLGREQAEADRLYAPLKAEFPRATAIGENAKLAAVPMGQATAFGRVAAPAVVAAGTEALKPGSPEERARGGVRKGLEAAVGGAVGEGFRRIIQPLPGVASGPVQAEARSAADVIPGVSLMPSQSSGSPGMRAVEDWLAQSPGGRGPIAAKITATQTALTRHAARGIGVPDADALTPDVLAKAASQIKDDYSRLAPGVKLDVTQPVLDAVDRAEKALMKGADAGKQDALSTIRKLKDQLYNTKSVSGDDWSVWQSDIGSIARSTENDRVGSVLGALRKELNDMARGPASAEWKAVDKRNAYLETLMKPNAIIDGFVNPKAVDRLLSSQFGKTYQTGNLKGELADIGRYGASVRNIREGSQTFGRQEMDSAVGLAKGLLKYPAAKAVTSEWVGDWLNKGLLASPEASRIGSTMAGSAALPLSSTIDLGLLGLLGYR